MKAINLLGMAAIVAFSLVGTSCNSQSYKKENVKTAADSSHFAGYEWGLYLGSGLRQQFENMPGDLNKADIMKGITDAFEGDTSKIKIDQMQIMQYLNDFFSKAQAKAAIVNKAEGEKFLAANKSKAGVQTTADGLQYQVVTKGTGAMPNDSSTVRVNYVGSTTDGTVFDSTKDHGQPAEFSLKQVIRGWSEGIKLMPVGSKYIFWIPAELGYGEQSPTPKIKPNSVLKFEVELLEIVDPSKVAAPAASGPSTPAK